MRVWAKVRVCVCLQASETRCMKIWKFKSFSNNIWRSLVTFVHNSIFLFFVQVTRARSYPLSFSLSPIFFSFIIIWLLLSCMAARDRRRNSEPRTNVCLSFTFWLYFRCLEFLVYAFRLLIHSRNSAVSSEKSFVGSLCTTCVLLKIYHVQSRISS